MEQEIITGHEGVEVGLKIDGVNRGYFKDYYTKHEYQTPWEVYGLRINGINIPYTASGVTGKNGSEILIELNTMTFKSDSESYGTVSTNSLAVVKNTTYTTNGNTLTLSDGRKVTANTSKVDNHKTIFDGWSSTSGTVTSAITITAKFSAQKVEPAYIDLNYNVDGARKTTRNRRSRSRS